MIKLAFPVQAGNDAVRDGKIKKVFQGLFEERKPEAAYFFGRRRTSRSFWGRYEAVVTDLGNRRTLLLALNARIGMVPVGRSSEGLVRGAEHPLIRASK